MGTGKKAVVEFYFNSDKGVVMDRNRQNMPPFRQIYGRKSQTWESEMNIRGLSFEDTKILELLEGICIKHGFVLKLYDTDRLGNRFRAWRKGITALPAIVFSGKSLAEPIDRRNIMNFLAIAETGP